MFSKSTLAAVVLATAVNAQTYTISTPPSLIQCQPAALSWSGGTPPYILDAIPGGQVSAAPLEELSSSASGTSFTWVVNLAEGTSVTLKLTDATGAIAYSSPNIIQAGGDSSCLNATATSAAGAAGVTGQGSSIPATSINTAIASSFAASSSSAAAVASSLAVVQSASAASSSLAVVAASASAVVASASQAAVSASAAAVSALSSAKAAATSTPVASASASASSTGGAFVSSSVEVPALVLAVIGGIAALL